MWFKTRNEALLYGLRRIGRAIDPERLEQAAREAGVKLPVTCSHVMAPSFSAGVSGVGWTMDADQIGELGVVVDRLMATRRAA